MVSVGREDANANACLGCGAILCLCVFVRSCVLDADLNIYMPVNASVWRCICSACSVCSGDGVGGGWLMMCVCVLNECVGAYVDGTVRSVEFSWELNLKPMRLPKHTWAN